MVAFFTETCGNSDPFCGPVCALIFRFDAINGTKSLPAVIATVPGMLDPTIVTVNINTSAWQDVHFFDRVFSPSSLNFHDVVLQETAKSICQNAVNSLRIDLITSLGNGKQESA